MPAQKKQWEEEAIDRFISFLNRHRSTAYAVTGRDVRPDPSSKNDFDYQIQDAAGNKAAVEIFRLVEDEQDLARDKVWGDVVGRLREELLKRNIKGYFISTPYFTVKKSELAAYSVRLAEQLEIAILGNATEERFESGGFEFHKIDGLAAVSFTVTGGARSIDPTGTSVKRFEDLLPTKNQQLAAKDCERILLVLNWAIFVDAGDAVRALTKIDFANYENIDRIYFEQRPGDFYQIFDRSILDAIDGASPETQPSGLLLETLRYRLGDKNPAAFDFVKNQTAARGNISWLTDDAARENLVHFGDDLLKNGAIDDVLWIVRQLKDDADPPPSGANRPDDPAGNYNYHAQVLRGEDARIITTVRGHLCWLMARLVALNRPELYSEVIEILRQYIAEPNLYIRIQATYVLHALIQRRRAIRNQDGSPFDWNPAERKLVAALAFQMLRENRAHPRVLEALVHVFSDFRDLSHEEAREVISTFLASGADYVEHDFAPLLMFFAFFRAANFADLGPFDDKESKATLEQQVTSGTPAMRSSLAWHFWKLMEQDEIAYAEIRSYLPLFWSTGYDQEVASMFGLLFEQLAQKAPEDAIDLFDTMIHLVREELRKQPADRLSFWVNGVEHIYPLLPNEPARLLRITEILKDISLLGCPYVGDFQMIFGSYALVPQAERERTKEALQILYSEIKTADPRVPDIDWER